MKSQGKTKTPTINFIAAGIVAAISDGLDFVGIGEIPGLSEVEDAITTAILYKLLGPIALISASELLIGIVEVTEPIPIQLITVAIAWLRKK